LPLCYKLLVIVQAFIDEIDSWLLSNGVSIPFTMQFFLFGDTSKSSRGDVINLILLLHFEFTLDGGGQSIIQKCTLDGGGQSIIQKCTLDGGV
jgi:hypothetical protein